MKIQTEPLLEKDAEKFLSMINEMAIGETGKEMPLESKERLIKDIFVPHPKFEVVMAYEDGQAVGFLGYFEAYKTFLAKPTMFMEDLFVLPDHRKKGVGAILFAECVRIAKKGGKVFYRMERDDINNFKI